MNCESCANLMQYYVNAKNSDEAVLEAVKNLSENVDHISEYRVIGGEPLMNKNFHEISLKAASYKNVNKNVNNKCQ